MHGSAIFSIAGTQAETPTLEMLYHHYYGPIRKYLYQLCGSLEQAEDLTQETFIKAGRGLRDFRGESSPATWLFRIARHTYLTSVRRPQSQRIPTDEFLAIPDRSSQHDPQQHVSALAQRDLIWLALAQLPEKQRSIVLLRDDEGLSYAEIAAILGSSLAAVKVNLFRARNAFRAAYRALEQEEGIDGAL